MTYAEIPGLDALLAGYDVFGTYANPDSSRELLFKKGQLEEFTFLADAGTLTFLKPAWVRHERIFETKSWTKTTLTQYDYKTSIAMRTKVEGGTVAFHGEVEASFDKEQSQASSRAYSGYEDIITLWQLSLPNEDPKKRLTDQAKKDIDNPNLAPDALMAKYGTHYLKGLKVGGKMFRYCTTDTTKYSASVSIEEAAKLSYKSLTGQLSVEESVKYSSAISTFNACSETYAGSRGGGTAFSNEILLGTFNGWCASVKDNPVLIDFPPTDALVGIWTLASAAERQNAIKRAFDAQVQEKSCVHYGDQVYLKVESTPARYLTGAREADNYAVYTQTTVDKDANFRWVVSKNHVSTTPGQGLVQYGDIVYLDVTFREDRLLTGARGGSNESVYTRNPHEEPSLMSYYQWKIMKSRSSVGSGPVPYDDAVNGTLYLKCQGLDNRWLTGGRGGANEAVLTKDGEAGAVEKTYRWLMKRKVD